jgi:hypothetical protein
MRVLVAGVLAVGCYSPSPHPGAPCADGKCPAGLVCAPATQTCETSAIDAASGGDAMRDANTQDAAPDAAKAFLYRRRLTIHNTSTMVLPVGFTIRVTIPTLGSMVQQGKIQGSYADLRVIGDGSISERDRIVDPAGGPAPSAVSFSLAESLAAGGTTSQYALYYGNPAPGAAPADGSAVFPVYDDFASGISNVWVKHDAPVTSGGKLVLRGGHLDALTTVASTDGVPIVSAVEVMANVVDPTSEPTTQPEGTLYYWFGYQRTGADFVAGEPWSVWIARGKSSIQFEQQSPVGCEMNCIGASAPLNTAPHYYAIERDPSGTRFYRDGTLAGTIVVSNTQDYSVLVRNFLATSDVQVDYVRARARVTPDPTITLGSEENL